MSTQAFIYHDPKTGRRALIAPGPDAKIRVSDRVARLTGIRGDRLPAALSELLAEHYTSFGTKRGTVIESGGGIRTTRTLAPKASRSSPSSRASTR